MFVFEGYEDESKGTTIFQLPTDPKKVKGQRKRKAESISTIDISSGYGTATLSECGTMDSVDGTRPRF